MKTSSCKAKGRNLQNIVAKALDEKYNYDPEKQYFNFRPALMGESGEDIKVIELIDAYKCPFGWSIECKNQENWSIAQWWKQAVANTKKDRKPLLVIKKNHHEPLVVMRFSDWLELI